MLLLDQELRVLAVNRALADFVGVAQLDLVRYPIDLLHADGESLATRIGYGMDRLREDCARLLERGQPDRGGRYVEPIRKAYQQDLDTGT